MRSRLAFKRLAQTSLLCIAALTMLGAGTPATTFDRIGHKMMCTCGCAEGLLDCNHVGCPDSPHLIAELHAQVDAGTPQAAILTSFAEKYGATVLAAPLRGGFDYVAWIVPFAVLALGLVAVVLVLKLWQRRAARLAPLGPSTPPTAEDDALRDRIRNETHYGE
jgi:cytochrome c-type biogenesis protein CcmH/NrfF